MKGSRPLVVALTLVLCACGPKSGNNNNNNNNNGADGGPLTCGTGLTQCGSSCFDLTTNVGNCGACGTACYVGETCSASHCISPTSPPSLSSLSPGSLQQGQLLTLQLNGTNFANGAQIRMVGALSGEFPLAVTGGTSAQLANFNTADGGTGSVLVRLVNPDHVASNELTLLILAPPPPDAGPTPLPTLVSLSPVSAATGSRGTLTVNGSNFKDPVVVSLADGGLATPHAYSSTFVDSTQAIVTAFDLTAIPAGSYTVFVTTIDGQSNSLPFAVLQPPFISSISPGRGQRGSTVTLTLNGSAFDSSAQAQISNGSGAPVAIATARVSATKLTAGPLNLTGYAPGNYGVFVTEDAGLVSNTVGFSVDPNDPSLFSATPAGAGQDQTAMNVTLNGAGFQSGAQAWVAFGNNPPTSLSTTYVDAGTLLISGWNLNSYALGTYSLTVTNPGSSSSGATGFTVSYGTPTITGINPTGAPSNTVVDGGTVTGTWFYPASVAYVDAGTNGLIPMSTTYVSPTQLSVTQDLTGVPPGFYDVTVVNPGPLTSNKTSFQVR